MRLLLDTHVFLWYISADSRLPVFYRYRRGNRFIVTLPRACTCILYS
jgi:hypothetical protein